MPRWMWRRLASVTRASSAAAAARAIACSVAAIVVLLGLASCEGIESAPPASCAAIGARCQLSSGPIGVCQETPCTGGAVAPCFVCTPQH